MNRLDAMSRIGFLTAGFAVVLFVLFILNLRAYILYGARDLRVLAPLAIYAGVTALGLLRRRKWGILLFQPPALLIGMFLVIATLWERIALYGTLVNFAFAACCFALSWLTLRCWAECRW